MYHGFHRSFCPGGAIGDGVYFAVNASYSNQAPYVLKKTNHRRELFICQVLLGNSSQGSYGAKSPAQGCHSLFNCNDHQNNMFCIFNNYQAYPEYIVQYDYE
jgi:poly [ADP-ribose] polymerase 10/14/15